MIHFLICTIGNLDDCKDWFNKNRTTLNESKGIRIHFNNSNMADEVINFFNFIEKDSTISVIHTKKKGIVSAFNDLIASIKYEKEDYFIHLGIDDEIIYAPQLANRTEDLLFLPVLDVDHNGKTKFVEARVPFSYFKRHRFYCPHHQGTLYRCSLIKPNKKFYSSDIGICFDAYKTLSLLEEGYTYALLKMKPMIKMMRGGLSSNLENVYQSNKLLTALLKTKPKIGQKIINYIANLIIDNKL